MKTITNKEYEQFRQYRRDEQSGRLLTPDGLRIICAANNNDPEQIGLHFLNVLANFNSEQV